MDAVRSVLLTAVAGTIASRFALKGTMTRAPSPAMAGEPHQSMLHASYLAHPKYASGSRGNASRGTARRMRTALVAICVVATACGSSSSNSTPPGDDGGADANGGQD